MDTVNDADSKISIIDLITLWRLMIKTKIDNFNNLEYRYAFLNSIKDNGKFENLNYKGTAKSEAIKLMITDIGFSLPRVTNIDTSILLNIIKKALDNCREEYTLKNDEKKIIDEYKKEYNLNLYTSDKYYKYWSTEYYKMICLDPESNKGKMIIEKHNIILNEEDINSFNEEDINSCNSKGENKLNKLYYKLHYSLLKDSVSNEYKSDEYYKYKSDEYYKIICIDNVNENEPKEYKEYESDPEKYKTNETTTIGNFRLRMDLKYLYNESRGFKLDLLKVVFKIRKITDIEIYLVKYKNIKNALKIDNDISKAAMKIFNKTQIFNILNKTQIFNIPFLLEIRKEKECKEKAEEYKKKAEEYEEKMKNNPYPYSYYYYYLRYLYYNKKIEACNNIQQYAGNKKQYRKIKNTNRIRTTRRKYLRKTKKYKNKHYTYSKQKQYIQK